MENQEIKNKLENIEILLQTIIQTSNDPKKKAEEIQYLKDAISSVNAHKAQLDAFVKGNTDKFTVAADDLKSTLKNFKPTVTQSQTSYNVDLTQPWYWFTAFAIALIISVGLNFRWFDQKEFYKAEDARKTPNFMKYKYIQYFDDADYVKELDAKYKKDIKGFNDKVLVRENELYNAANAEAEAKRQAAEAKRLKHVSDSLNNIKRY